MKNQDKSFEEIWDQVPPNYYQKGIEKNILQNIWHKNKLKYVVWAIKSQNKDPQNILDVGCASGWLLSELKKEFKKTEAFGIDVYGKAIDYGKKLYKNINLKKANAHKIPYPDKSFDVIVCSEVLEHVEDPDKVIKEMKRVLRRNGSLVVEIDTGNWLFKFVWFFWTNVRKGVWRDSHIHIFNTDKLKKYFIKNGLKIEKINFFNFSMAVVFTLRKE